MDCRSVIFLVLAAAMVGCGGSGGGSSVEPTPEQDAPVAFDLSASAIEVMEDEVATGRLEFDVDGAPNASVKFVAVTLPTKGTLWLEESGSFIYSPEADQTGADSFDVQLSARGQTSRSFSIPIRIQAVDDAPVVELTEGKFPPVGRSSTLSFHVYDPDSAISDVSADVAGATLSPVSFAGGHYRYQIRPGELSTVDFREPLRLTVSLKEDDVPLHRQFHLYRSLPGERAGAYTLLGSADKPGYDLVLLSDQYTAEQLPLFYQDIERLLQAKLDEPAINQVLDHWNLHVLFAPVEDESVSQFLIGEVCDGMCGDNALIEQTARDAFAQYDQSMVVLNTDRSGGAAGVVAVTSRLNIEATGWHELGHLYANLADEYDRRMDKAENPAALSKSQLASPPNVTFDPDPRNAPWAHWIEDFDDIPGTDNASTDRGVGFFLGAGATAEEAYRPTLNSMMRSGSEALGPVNSEAWVLAIYPYLDIANAAYPAERRFEGEGPVTFGLAGLALSELHRFQWRVDGVVTAHNALGIGCCSGEGAHDIQLDVISQTPMVRLLEPDNVIETIHWSFEQTATSTSAGAH